MQTLPKWPTVNTDSYFNILFIQSTSSLVEHIWPLLSDVENAVLAGKKGWESLSQGSTAGEVSFKIKLIWKVHPVRDDEKYIQTCVKNTEWSKNSKGSSFPDNFWLLELIPLLTNNRRQALKTSRTGSNTSGRWYRSVPFTWEERSKSPFTFPNQLQPSTTRGEGKHVTPTV